MHYKLSLLVLFFTVEFNCYGDSIGGPNLKLPNPRNSVKLPDCKLCRVLTESFQKGIEKTARGKHDGGDAAWEEEKLRSYKTSEVRLVEIQDHLCEDTGSSVDQCHSLANELEPQIEEWWFEHQTEAPELYNWLCIEERKVCCPINHFGPNCSKCSDCHGNGICKGNGTRKGNGQCLCDAGYSGESCNDCDRNYYESFRDSEKLLCSICHFACSDSGCLGVGPKNCRSCKSGWKLESADSGCVDVDECVENKRACKNNQFCVNNEGSFQCLECDKSCDGCVGDGPDLCDKCADGYELREGLCTDTTNEKRDNFVNFTRYLTYLGLCIATCVIFQSSTWIASCVGLAVALYISVSEYWLQTTPNPASNSPAIEIPKEFL